MYDEFPEHQGWSHQIYVREARRLVSDYVMTQHHCQGHETVPDPVGLAAYTMDSHNVQRYVDAKQQVRNDVEARLAAVTIVGLLRGVSCFGVLGDLGLECETVIKAAKPVILEGLQPR